MEKGASHKLTREECERAIRLETCQRVEGKDERGWCITHQANYLRTVPWCAAEPLTVQVAAQLLEEIRELEIRAGVSP